MRPHIAGATLCGFFGLFEIDYGDPHTLEPYATITPSRVGTALLPFRCPSCREVPQALACPKSRECFYDRRRGRGNHWCPLCGCRFFLDLRGTALPSALPAGADVAPSRVNRAGTVLWQDMGRLTLLGFLAGARVSGSYDALASLGRRI